MTTPAFSRAHFFRPVTDSDGNVVPNVRVTIYERGSSQLLRQVLYSTPRGSGSYSNPFTTSSGVIDFYLDQPQDVRVGLSVVSRGTETFIEDVGVLPDSSQLVRSTNGFRIANPPTPGSYLQASSEANALWVTADQVMASRPTPTVELHSYDFSTGFVDDLTFSNGYRFVDVTAEQKPVGFGFIQALDFTGTLTLAPVTFTEPGRVMFVYKPVAEGDGAARLQLSIDNEEPVQQTPVSADYLNRWSVGYLEIDKPGTHTVHITQDFGSDPDSFVLLGPVRVTAGNNMPPHEHYGLGEDSLRVGTGSVAAEDRTTALGGSAQALGVGATAVGSRTLAAARGTAVGATSAAGVDSTAVGYGVSGGVSRAEWTAVGAFASTSGDSATALGYRARGDGDRSVSVGASAYATIEAVALGARASAAGYRSVALGAGARADHPFSVAIGPGVVAAGPHEARLGDEETETVLPGALRLIGPQAAVGGVSSQVGFFGAAPIVRPVVRGSRNANAVLATLLKALDTMGLITDQSTG